MAANALAARDAAAAALANLNREITRYKAKPNPSNRLLNSKLEKLQSMKDDLFDKHCLYAEKAGLALTAIEQTNYINPLMDTASDLADELEVLIEQMDEMVVTNQKTLDDAALEQAKQNEITVAIEQNSSDELTLRDRVVTMLAIVTDPAKNDKEDATTVRSHLHQIEDLLQDQTKSWNALKVLPLTEEKRTELFATHQELRSYVSKSIVDATTYVSKIDPDSDILKRAESVTSSSSVNGDSNSNDSNRLLRLEKTKCPTFSGDIRNYARFRADFNNFVAPIYRDKANQVYVLKTNCLKGDVKKLVDNMSDLDSIWERLQGRYGDHMQIVNVVLKSIQNFTFGKSDHDKSLVKLVDELERGVEDLDSISSKQHLANALTVTIIEEKLTGSKFITRWLQKNCSSTGDDRFNEIFSFLKQERKQAERLILLTEKKNESNRNPPRTPPGNPGNRGRQEGNVNHADAEGGNGNFNRNHGCIIHPEANHFTRRCRQFLRKNVEERGQLLREKNWCKLCLSTSHGANPCPFEATWQKCGVDGCQLSHSKLVHGCTIPEINCHAIAVNASVSTPGSPGQTLLLIEKIKTSDGASIISFWDNGSTITLVSREYAVGKRLPGLPVSYDLLTVGGNRSTHHTTLYSLTIVDREQNKHTIQAFEIEEICGTLKNVQTDRFAQLFNLTSAAEIRRPKGKVQVLIGSNYLSLHPTKICAKEGLVLFESSFGTGRILGGNHHQVQETNVINADARLCASAHICNVRVTKDRIANPGLDFMTLEGFGVEAPRRCNNCKKCKECQFEAYQLSREKQRQLDIIRQNTSFDPVENVWTATYPCQVDPSTLPNNKPQARALVEKTEKRLLKDPATLAKFNEQFQNLLDRGVLVEISEEEDKEYAGPVFYVSMHEVHKPSSTSTPLRLVINSSLRYQGKSPNDTWMSGPNSLNDMFGILLRLREHKYAIIGDIKKMYTKILTTAKEKHMRRILWRFANTGELFKTFGVDCVMFGDRPAATIASVVIRETANIYKDINNEASEKIINDTFVDNITTGTDSKENIPILIKDITTILGHGGMDMHEFVVSGDSAPELLSLLGAGDDC